MVGKKYVASRNVKRLQEAFNSTPNPGFRLRRDLADAQAYLITVKATEKAKQRAKMISEVEARTVEAESEAHGALTAKIEAERASKDAKKAAKVARNDLRSLRNEHAPNSTLGIAESREQELRFAFYTADHADVSAEKQLYEADKRVQALQRHLTQLTANSASNEQALHETGNSTSAAPIVTLA